MARKAKSVRPPKKIEDMTISEFRAKLEGIEMFQAEDWHPDGDQWALIREMINHIVEEVIEVEKQVPVYPATPQFAPPVAPSTGSNLTQPIPQQVQPPVVSPPAEDLANLPLAELKKRHEAKATGTKLMQQLNQAPAVDTSGKNYSVDDSPFA